MAARSASQRRAADWTRVLRTALRSKVERLMTLSTSAVAVCCWSDSRSSLSSRVFSIAMTAWAAKLRSRSTCLSVNRRTPLRIVSMLAYVIDLDDLLSGCDPAERGIRRRSEQQLASARFGICRRRVVQGDRAKCVAFAEPKRAEFGLADANCVLEHGLEYGLQLARRA